MKMTDEYMEMLPVIPATSVQEIEKRLRPFAEAGVDRLIVLYVPSTMLTGSLKCGASYSLHLINESKTFETEL